MFKVRQNILLLFRILNLAIEGGNHDIVVSTNYNEIMEFIQSIMDEKPFSYGDESQLVSGLNKDSYV